MLKNLLKITFIAYLWSRYKQVIISTACLFIYIWLVRTLHDDFLIYAGIVENQENIGISFLIKWLAYISGTIVYLIYHHFRLKKNNKKGVSELQGIQSVTVLDNSQINTENDPFHEIRCKDKLRTQADFLIEKNTEN